MKQKVFPTYFIRRTSPFTIPYSGWICLQCRNQALISALHTTDPVCVPPSSRGYASSTNDPKTEDDPNSFTERLRRRIWKQDEPESQADPYGDKGIIGRNKKQSQATAVASTASQKPLPQDEYTPATSWDGLEQIGGATDWWEDAWDQEHQFEGFMSRSKLETRGSISSAIYQALVEIYTLRKAALPLTVSKKGLDRFYIENSARIEFQKRENGKTVLKFSDENLRQEILNLITNDQPPPGFDNTSLLEPASSMEESSQTADKEVPTDQIEALSINHQPLQGFAFRESDTSASDPEMSSLYTPNGISWLYVLFDDLIVKFAILKRVMQLTGIRIPDPEIDVIWSTKALLGHLVKKPKPKKLAENLISNKRLSTLSNVKIMDRRYTPIDKEKEIGRWKVIEKELIRRDLPVTGNTTSTLI